MWRQLILLHKVNWLISQGKYYYNLIYISDLLACLYKEYIQINMIFCVWVSYIILKGEATWGYLLVNLFYPAIYMVGHSLIYYPLNSTLQNENDRIFSCTLHVIGINKACKAHIWANNRLIWRFEAHVCSWWSPMVGRVCWSCTTVHKNLKNNIVFFFLYGPIETSNTR